jgi:hypothetical protein
MGRCEPCTKWKLLELIRETGVQSAGMWRRVGLVKTGVSEERVASIYRVEEITRARKSVRRLLTD